MEWLIVFTVTTLLTGLMVKFSWVFGLIDKPDARRTHTIPTPRGGGLPMVLIFTSMVFQPIYLAALAIAFMGFWDDIQNISAKWRFLFQILIACVAIYMLNGLHSISFYGFAIPVFIFVFFMVWITNLYNFMDGINGLAGLEAIFLCLSMAFLTKQHSNEWFILASATMGFLVWNFPKARIFLGDVGSQFLGFIFALMLVREALQGEITFISGLILMGFFMVDTTLTLMTRMLTQQKFSEAHRSHIYQILWKKLNANHFMVTSLVMVVNVFWLFPWAYAVSHGYVSAMMGLLISYFPLVIMGLIFKAGRLTS